MRAEPVSTQQFIALWKKTNGSPTEVGKILGRSPRSVSNRRREIEKTLGITLASGSVHSSRTAALLRKNHARLQTEIQDGVIVAFGDAHYWPGPATTAHRGLVEVIKRVKPCMVVNLGDAFDGAKVSRHDRLGWDQRPTVKQELDAVQERLGEVQKAAGSVPLVWTQGNHDARFDTRLAILNPEYEGVPGTCLKDHFPEWQFCIAMWVNGSVLFKHAWHNGIHAQHNNVVKGAVSMVTGHLHSQKVTPWTNARETVYGVDAGTLADPNADQFDYCHENPKNWRSGFAVLTFKDGKLLLPELAQVWDEDHIQFRGELIGV